MAVHNPYQNKKTYWKDVWETINTDYTIKKGDIVVIHDTGAHGHAMGFNYNGKLRSAEVLLKEDGTAEMIRRAKTYDDLFATLKF